MRLYLRSSEDFCGVLSCVSLLQLVGKVGVTEGGSITNDKEKSVERQTEFSFRMPHFDTGTRSIKDNIYVKILVTLWQSSLHVSHLGAAAGYVGPSYKNYILFIDFGKTG